MGMFLFIVCAGKFLSGAKLTDMLEGNQGQSWKRVP